MRIRFSVYKSRKGWWLRKGSFVNSDKFKESDLNFYISVKVVNQTINFKDALVYNPVRSVNSKNFKDVFGDSFISGFVEGGEFNAIVSMKILNKAKMEDIKAAGKVALTAGPVDGEIEASVGVARSNLETNTETTIQVSWSGGGHIKPMEQQWDIPSLMQAAARFPDLVADCPQRTYAILTKYDSLRSFVALKPAEYSPLQYENAQIYTNSLLDAYMSYKAIYKQIGEHIFRVKANTLNIVPWDKDPAQSPSAPSNSTGGSASKGQDSTKEKKPLVKDTKTGMYPFVEDNSRFEASIKGLSDAMRAIRRQMARIVNEVDLIEQDPKRATDEDHEEPFQSPSAFEARIPAVEIPDHLKRKSNPLSGRLIKSKELSAEDEEREQMEEDARQNAPRPYVTNADLSPEETKAFDQAHEERPGIGLQFRATSGVGSYSKGIPFNNLDIIKPEWNVDTVRFQIYKGYISYVAISYTNGLLIGKGLKRNDAKSVTLGPFKSGERIISASIEDGILEGDNEKRRRVLAVGLFTSRGRSLLASARTEPTSTTGRFSKDESFVEGVKVSHFESPLEDGTLKGFFGINDDNSENSVIFRLGIIWGHNASVGTRDPQELPLALASLGSVTRDSHSPQSGSNIMGPDWKPQEKWAVPRQIKFEPAYDQPPLMVSGLRLLDVGKDKALSCNSNHYGVTSEKASAMICTYNDPMFALDMSWLSIPKTDKHIEAGVYEFIGGETTIKQAKWTKIEVTLPFAKPFHDTPVHTSWLTNVARCNTKLQGWSAWCSTEDVTTESAKISYERYSSDDEQGFVGVRVAYFFYDAKECTNIQQGYLGGPMGVHKKEGRFSFPTGFKTTPVVFLAVKYFEAGPSKNLRLFGEVFNVTEDGFDYKCGTWSNEGDHEMHRFQYTWIAIA